MNKKFFETKIKPLLNYIGLIGSIITSIAYIIVVVVLIIGFNSSKTFSESITFSIVSALIGLIIIQFMKIQGITFAKNLEENQEILKLYYHTKTKDKKLRSIRFYWITSVIKDVLLKATTMALTTASVIYIVIAGTQDWNMFLLAIVNLLMFICFGILTLSNSYDFFNNKHIPYLKEMLKLEDEECLTLTEKHIET